MFQALTIWFDKEARFARRIAFAAFDERHPRLKREGTLSLRRQDNKIVVAIAYSTGLPQRPSPYKVYVVSPTSKTATEIDLQKHPQYALRCRK